MNLWGLSHNLFDYSHTEMNYEVCPKNLVAVEKRFSSTVRADVHTEFRLALATLLQRPRKTGWCLQERCKCRGKLVGVCRNAAKATENWLVFAGTLQRPRKTGWRLQECCKGRGKLVDVCRNAANAAENWLAFAGTLQMPRKTGCFSLIDVASQNEIGRRKQHPNNP